MREKNLQLRESFYELLPIVKLNKHTLLMDIIVSLRENIKRYPQDLPLIYACGAKLGAAYAEFVKLNVLLILQHDLHFLIREHDRDDPIHVFHVIMVENAVANSRSAQGAKLPDYFVK